MSTEIVTRVITFFFPYDSKVEENTHWFYGDPRDYGEGHPHGHEMWGHGERHEQSSEDSDDWEFLFGWGDDESSSTRPSFPIPSSTWQPFTSVPPLESSSNVMIVALMTIYAILMIFAFVFNLMVANVIKRCRWGMKMALFFHLCLTGAILCITNTIHLVASMFHLIRKTKKIIAVLQAFAIVAWIDHIVGFALLAFVMYLAMFCFNFYWNNKSRSVEWGRRYIIHAVLSSWILSFLIAGFSAYFQCDAHVEDDQCIRILCTTSNLFSAIFTELLTRVKIVIPIVILLLILLSVRVGSSKQRMESMVKIEGADVHGDRELLLICSLVFLIYELCTLIPQILVAICISPLVSVCAYHFGVLLSTLAMPIAVVLISRNTRHRLELLYTCSATRGRTAPLGSYTHVARKYRESVQEDERPRCESAMSSHISQGISEHRKLSIINEEKVGKQMDQNSVESISISSPKKLNDRSITPCSTIKPRRMSLVHEAPETLERRRFSNFELPQIGDRPRLLSLVEARIEHRSAPVVNYHLPQHIFVHHVHESVKPIELVVKSDQCD